MSLTLPTNLPLALPNNFDPNNLSHVATLLTQDGIDQNVKNCAISYIFLKTEAQKEIFVNSLEELKSRNSQLNQKVDDLKKDNEHLGGQVDSLKQALCSESLKKLREYKINEAFKQVWTNRAVVLGLTLVTPLGLIGLLSEFEPKESRHPQLEKLVNYAETHIKEGNSFEASLEMAKKDIEADDAFWESQKVVIGTDGEGDPIYGYGYDQYRHDQPNNDYEPWD